MSNPAYDDSGYPINYANEGDGNLSANPSYTDPNSDPGGFDLGSLFGGKSGGSGLSSLSGAGGGMGYNTNINTVTTSNAISNANTNTNQNFKSGNFALGLWGTVAVGILAFAWLRKGA